MITIQHTALYFTALQSKRRKYCIDEFRSELPFVLLPDALRAYIGARQIGHFEMTADGKQVSWMRYPSETVLKTLTRDNAAGMIQHYLVPNLPKCDFGETTSISEFDAKNWRHKHFNSIRVHLLQDCVMDATLRDKMVDFTDRFENRYVPYGNPNVVLDGATVRTQVTLFEKLGFLRLAGAAYERTGELLNRDWFDTYVLESLKAAYPEDLANNTYKYMGIPDDINNRITSKNFELTEAEREALFITARPEQLMDEMYAEAYLKTYYEL